MLVLIDPLREVTKTTVGCGSLGELQEDSTKAEEGYKPSEENSSKDSVRNLATSQNYIYEQMR